MADPFVAEIRMFPFHFAPTGWAACDGQLLPISQNTALFSLLGTNYGGDGKTNFALPDLRNRTPLGPGHGPGLSPYALAQSGGVSVVSLSSDELPAHTHTINTTGAAATTGTPGAAVQLANANASIYGAPQNLVPMEPVGNPALPHNNRQPYLGLQFCIALQGVFPPRS